MMIRNPRHTPMTLSALLLVMSLSSQTFAQETTGNDSTVVYPAAYFSEYAPLTAQDMLNRIPGIGSGGGGGGGGPGGGGGGGGNPGGGGRGLGSGGGDQVLINGKRSAGKNNDTRSMLGRINATQVDRIEIIRGTSGALDVRGSNQVINVVLFEELSSTSISWEANVDRYADHETQPGGSLSVSGQTGALTYLFSAQAEPRYDHYISKENSVLGDFSANDEVREDRIREQTSYQYSTNLSYELTPNSSVRLNGLYGQNDNPTKISRVTTNLKVNPRTLSYEREDIPGERDNWEIGGDYEYLTAGGSRFKALFITNENDGSSLRERYRVNADGSETKSLFLDSGSVSKERILRSSYTMGLMDGQDIEFGIERAQTILDSYLRLGLASSTGTPSAAFGGLVPQNVANANSMVEEMRYEPFAVHNWQINQRMSLESTLVWETSEITQTGDVYNQRSFDFWKPKVDYRFDVASNFQLRAMAEYNVRQLSFSDFVAATDNQDNDKNTQAGNSNLEPETFINADLDAEYRLPDDIGVVTARINFMRHYDKIERIDVTTNEAKLQSANGNIGTGDMWVFSINSSIRMKMINMPNLLVTTNFQVRDSKIKDPFLGINRRFTNFERGRLDLRFRHDLPQYNMNYGLSWNNRFDGNIKRYDIEDIELTSGDPMVMAFVEFVAFNGITFRFDARNATDNLQCRERLRYVGRTSAGILEEIEDQCGGSGRVLSLKINGSF
ncbi:MAG: TonB-dependent receptor plug domain-containing protein [Gammaproteobacteria bacterium]|nr:TonB-dependent receptor plug domain-containing protein [Gammaproteobacteria bacterium]MDP2141652.1 TonB-dependent receptor plug domain-containing protein [Gammaproteobacteria bacterium]MDP2346373.1 TonB-dependent receptor plug domain-containing protein [Gammaproteobacteria bacterium]